MGVKLIATYYILNYAFHVYGCYDEYTEINKYNFYDLYDNKGNCINEGTPFFKIPTWKDIKEYVEENNII